MERKRLEIILFAMLFAGIAVLAFFVFRPFFHILILAGVLAVLFEPRYKRVVHFFGRGKNFFAIVVVLLVLIFLILPILFFGLNISGQAQHFFALTSDGQVQSVLSLQHTIERVVQNVFPNFTLDIADYSAHILNYLSSNIGAFLSQTLYVFLQLFLLLFTFFFFLRDGDKMIFSISSLSPFESEQTKKIMDSISGTITSVIRGTIFVGLIRWVVFSAGFLFFGVPNAMLWGIIGGIIGAIPGLGTPFVIIPAVLYFVFSGNIILAIGMGVFGALIMIFVDNMLSAYFFGKALDAPPIFVLFSILGGVFYFGPLGFIFGPIILSLFISIVQIYRILILKKE